MHFRLIHNIKSIFEILNKKEKIINLINNNFITNK